MTRADHIRKYVADYPHLSSAEIRDKIMSDLNIPESEKARVHSHIRTIKTRDSKAKHPLLETECDELGIPIDNVSHYWHKGKHFSIHVKKDVDDFREQIREIVQNYVPKKNIQLKRRKDTTEKILKVTLSDMHVGLDPNPYNSGIFQYEYNEDVFNHNIDHVIVNIIKEFNTHGTFECLYIDDLGDGLDGLNNQTTRGGHILEQNMDNKTAFKTFISGKLRLIEDVISMGVANKVITRNVSNDNHSGDFSFMANFTIQSMLERTYGNTVDFYILERFMEHFAYGDHTWILTHGKDKKHRKFGLDLDLSPTTINFVTDYINHYNINSKYIHVEKGDLHQVGYKRTTRFDYRNFMSFAPPSNWVQHNHGDSYSGYSIQVIGKHSNDISHTDYFFELDKKY